MPVLNIPTADSDYLNRQALRIAAFMDELALARKEIADASVDYIALNEKFADACIERDAVALKLTAHNVLLQRVLDADAGCTGEAYAQLIEDIKAAMEVQS